MIENEKFSIHTKHLDLRYQATKHLKEDDIIELRYRPTENMIDDFLSTKVPKPQLMKHSESMLLMHYPSEVLTEGCWY